jgi:hypothetical protein
MDFGLPKVLIDNSAAVELWWRGENGLRPKERRIIGQH